MAINRSQLAKELEPGLNALFGMEYARYDSEHEEIYETESSDRAFEEEVMIVGFGNASVKAEGAGVSFDNATEGFTSRYNHETASVLNNAFDSNFTGGDGQPLVSNAHPLGGGGTASNRPTTYSDLNETSLEDALISISTLTDDRQLQIALKGMKLIVPPQLQFVADRLLNTPGRVGTSDNDINAIRNMGMCPDGYVVNHYLTDNDAWFLKTDCPDGFKHFQRSPMSTALEGDFDTGNMRYKARERYSFGFSNWRAVFASQGA